MKRILTFGLLAAFASGAQTASAALIVNTAPNFSQTGDYFATYKILSNPDPNGAGFYLIQVAARPAMPPLYPGGFGFPAQPASSKLSAFSNSGFKSAAYNDLVDASYSFPGNQLTLADGVQQYVAFNLIDQLNSNSVYYGWMNVTVSGVGTMGAVQFTLNSWAYENTGAAVRVGQIPSGSSSSVPEPAQVTTSLVLLMGMAGLVYTRHRAVKPVSA